MAGSWGLAYFLEALFILASDCAVKEVNLILIHVFLLEIGENRRLQPIIHKMFTSKEVITIEIEEPVSLNFSLRYLNSSTKATQVTNQLVRISEGFGSVYRRGKRSSNRYHTPSGEEANKAEPVADSKPELESRSQKRRIRRVKLNATAATTAEQKNKPQVETSAEIEVIDPLKE
ncbi:unnamed protein product [Prunus armeniaca]|uniref:Proliferating cell nuclear antigen PCNA C-terminal domain-containing protein n=1 Tax=Prunus armeniaca TaxID=36596 RepID=A0A6J5U3Y2_PRUAR|nr:unnamed protein product [Prunus armeniaca]